MAASVPEDPAITIRGVKDPLLEGVVGGAGDQNWLPWKVGHGENRAIVGTLHHRRQLLVLKVPEGDVAQVVSRGHDWVLIRAEAD